MTQNYATVHPSSQRDACWIPGERDAHHPEKIARDVLIPATKNCLLLKESPRVKNKITKPIKVKRSALEGEFTALASTYELDGHGDRIIPGAFEKTLADWAARAAKIPILWNHDPGEPLGAATSAIETDEGLEVTCVFETVTDRGKQAQALLKTGCLSMSIGFNIPRNSECFVQNSATGETERQLSEIDLREISLVAIPSNRGAVVRTVKQFESPRELEKALREQLKLSTRQAKKLMSGGWAAMSTDAPEPDESDLIQQLREIFQ